MHRGWLALVLSACTIRPAPVAPTSPPIAAAPTLDPPIVDPPDPPCPTPGWATPATLVGAWHGGRRSLRANTDPPPSYLHLARGREIRLRHDFRPDGTVTETELTREHELADTQQRRERTGTWRVDPTGALELSWDDGPRTTTRERIWLDIRFGVPALRRRTLERGADDVWRGARFEETVSGGHAYGHEIQVELRFSPPLTAYLGTCEVEITRRIKLWGAGKPITWTSRTRQKCELKDGRLHIDEERARWPDHDDRLVRAYDRLRLASLVWLSPDVLHEDAPEFDLLPSRRSRPADPPISWHEARSHERCTRTRPIPATPAPPG